MSPTQIEEQNNEEETTEPLVFDSGASAHFYPTAFDEESPNDGRSQEHKIIIATGVALNEELLLVGKLVSVGTLVRRQNHPADLLTRPISDGRQTQTYASLITSVTRLVDFVRPVTSMLVVILVALYFFVFF